MDSWPWAWTGWVGFWFPMGRGGVVLNLENPILKIFSLRICNFRLKGHIVRMGQNLKNPSYTSCYQHSYQRYELIFEPPRCSVSKRLVFKDFCVFGAWKCFCFQHSYQRSELIFEPLRCSVSKRVVFKDFRVFGAWKFFGFSLTFWDLTISLGSVLMLQKCHHRSSSNMVELIFESGCVEFEFLWQICQNLMIFRGWFSLTSCKLYGTYENCHKGGLLTRFFLSILMIYYDGDIENRAY